MAAAVFCRAGWQDDSTGHQHLQYNHQDEVKVDLNRQSGRGSRDTTAEGQLKKGNLICLCATNKLEDISTLLQRIYIDSWRVQDQFTSEPNQAGGRYSKCWHIDHLEIWHLEKKTRKHETFIRIKPQLPWGNSIRNPLKHNYLFCLWCVHCLLTATCLFLAMAKLAIAAGRPCEEQTKLEKAISEKLWCKFWMLKSWR